MQAAVARVLLGQPQAALDLIVPSAEGPRCVGHRAQLLYMSDSKAGGALTDGPTPASLVVMAGMGCICCLGLKPLQ